MKRILPLLLLALAGPFASAEIPADSYSRPIFSDDFSGADFGKRWGHYKSSSIIKDGMLVGITAEDSDHPAVENIRIEPERDLEVSVKFRFVSEKANNFCVWLDDKDYKGSHAGHICSVIVGPKGVAISDAKNGNFRNDMYAKRTAPEGFSAEDKAYLQTMTKNTPGPVSREEWHTLAIRTQADAAEVTIDGKPAGAFKSPGIAHDTKTLVSLTTNRVDVTYDDFSIKGVAKAAAAGQ